ncbi:MAG: hypothetical protein Fur0037_22830 [Planctomycetota bacterium]
MTTTDPTRAPSPRKALSTPILLFLGSLKLTVLLLVLLGLLTYFGTLAQTEQGIYYVQKDYFESWWVRVPIGRFDVWRIWFPLPGALPVLGLLFVNLLVGGVLRMRLHARNIGVLVTHLGVLLLLVAGFVKMEMSHAGHMSLYEGDTGALIRSYQEWELALMRRDGDGYAERTVHGSAIEGAVGDRRIRIDGDGLPFAVEVHHFYEHCVPVPKGPMFEATAPLVDGVFLASDPRFVPPTSSREQKLAGCYVDVVGRDGQTVARGILWAGDTIKVGTKLRPFCFDYEGQSWGIELRHQLWALPFDVRLDRFKKSEHPGSMMVRDYSSFVTVTDPDGTSRPAHIYMNEPLRKAGYVFYQTSWGPQNSPTGPYYSTFEVANNPSDKWPEYACYVIGAGMLIHFLSKLRRFIASEGRRRSKEIPA